MKNIVRLAIIISLIATPALAARLMPHYTTEPQKIGAPQKRKVRKVIIVKKVGRDNYKEGNIHNPPSPPPSESGKPENGPY